MMQGAGSVSPAMIEQPCGCCHCKAERGRVVEVPPAPEQHEVAVQLNQVRAHELRKAIARGTLRAEIESLEATVAELRNLLDLL